MREADFRLLARPADLEGDRRAVPLGLILEEIERAIGDKPGHFFSGYQFGDLLFAVMNFFVAVGEFIAELRALAADLSLPPCADIINGSECFFRSLVGGE